MAKKKSELEELRTLCSKQKEKISELIIKLIKLDELNRQQFEMIVHLERQVIEYEKLNVVYRRFPRA